MFPELLQKTIIQWGRGKQQQKEEEKEIKTYKV